jgi:molybdopterin synthase sulfur carrier subunit
MRSKSPDARLRRPPGTAPTVAVRVLIPGILRSYTGGAERLDVEAPCRERGAAPTLGAVLAALDARCPGLKFRIVDEQDHLRPHIRIFVGRDAVRDLEAPVPPTAEVMVVGALSGG